MQSKATTVQAYLAELPADRRAAISAVRKVILKNLDEGYQERMAYGMIGYSVPHSIFPAGYNCDPKQPLPFAGLGSQKNHMSLYMMCTCFDGTGDKWLRTQLTKSGKKLDMGKGCIRFRKIEDLPLDVIGEAVRRSPLKKYVASYEAFLAERAKVGPTPRATIARAAEAKRKAAAKSAAAKKKKGARKP